MCRSVLGHAAYIAPPAAVAGLNPAAPDFCYLYQERVKVYTASCTDLLDKYSEPALRGICNDEH